MSKDIERFWSKVKVPEDWEIKDQCWEWIGHKDKDEYGRFWINDKIIGAHRFSYELYNGVITNQLQILHKCDNPPCVNPNHLFAGTNQDNIIDRVNKNRSSRRYDLDNHFTKYNNDFIIEILENIKNNKLTNILQIMNLYNVSEYWIRGLLFGYHRIKITYNYDLEDLRKIVKMVNEKWIVIDQNNVEYLVDNMREFCKVHNLSTGCMSSITNKESINKNKGYKLSTYIHKGYKCYTYDYYINNNQKTKGDFIMKTNEMKFGVAIVASIYEVENAISTEGASDVTTPACIAKAIQSVLGVQGSDSVQEAKATGGDVTADR